MQRELFELLKQAAFQLVRQRLELSVRARHETDGNLRGRRLRYRRCEWLGALGFSSASVSTTRLGHEPSHLVPNDLSPLELGLTALVRSEHFRIVGKFNRLSELAENCLNDRKQIGQLRR